MIQRKAIVIVVAIAVNGFAIPMASAQYYSNQLRVLGVMGHEQTGQFEEVEIAWDGKQEPDKPVLRWSTPRIQPFGHVGVYGGVKLGTTGKDAVIQAFKYAIEHTPAAQHSGTVTVRATSYMLTVNEGPSAGAAMAVAFMAMFNKVPLRGDICMTGALESGGRIGKVGAIPQKMQAARSGGCTTILVPRDQTYGTGWNLEKVANDLRLKLMEVDLVEDAYAIMTAPRL